MVPIGRLNRLRSSRVDPKEPLTIPINSIPYSARFPGIANVPPMSGTRRAPRAHRVLARGAAQ